VSRILDILNYTLRPGKANNVCKIKKIIIIIEIFNIFVLLLKIKLNVMEENYGENFVNFAKKFENKKKHV